MRNIIKRNIIKRLSLYTMLVLIAFLLVHTSPLFATDVTLAWDPKTDSGLAGYRLYYGTASRNYSAKIDVGNNTTGTVPGLNPGTYYFAVTAYYTSGSETGFSNEVSTTISSTPSPDTTPPTISNVTSSNLTSSGATIAWTTNEASDSQVEYGTTTAYGKTTSLNTTLVTNHSVSLSGLSAATLYHYRVKSKDAAGNLAVSTDFTFTTLAATDTTPPTISNVTSSNIASSGATIAWTTNESSDSQVEYGTSTAYGKTTSLNTTLVTNHSVSLSGLSAATLYHYRARSKDAAGNLAVSTDFTFTTLAASTPTPSLTSFKTPSSITIDGVLAEAVWSQANSVTFSNASLSDNQVKVSTLWDDTNLYFAYDVKDANKEAVNGPLYQDDGAELYLDTDDNKSTTMDADDYSFVININNLTSTSGIIAKTSLNSAGYTMEIAIPWSIIQTVPSLNKKIGLLLANNDRDNGVSTQFDWLNVVATGNFAQPNLWGDLILGASLPVSSDTTPPTISNVLTSNISDQGATISWSTNESSDTQVEYGTTTAYGNSTPLVSTLVTSHLVLLSGWQPDTLYHFRVKSRDAAGNLATSADFTVQTLLPPPTLVTVK